MPRRNLEHFPPVSFLELSEASPDELHEVIWKSAFKKKLDDREFYAQYREEIFRYLAYRKIQQQTSVIPSFLVVEKQQNQIRFLEKTAYFYRVFCYQEEDQLPIKVKIAWFNRKFTVEMLLGEISQQELIAPRNNVIR